MKQITFLTLIFIVLNSCTNNQEKKLGNDTGLFDNSPAYQLASAVEKENTEQISKLCKSNTSLISYQETRFGQSLLQWAVYTNRYKATKALLGAGADPNLQSYDGTSAFIYAAANANTTDYVKLLLRYGGDPNDIATPKIKTRDHLQQLKTPLIAAAGSRLETVKVLVEAGSNIDYINDEYQSALHEACIFDNIEIVYYLVVEKGANFKQPLMKTISGKSVYLTDLLRDMAFPLESEEYKIKMKVVAYLKNRGMDYWSTEIPAHLYDIYSKEYLEKY